MTDPATPAIAKAGVGLVRFVPKGVNWTRRKAKRKRISSATGLMGLAMKMQLADDLQSLATLAKEANELRPLIDTHEWVRIKRSYWQNPIVPLPQDVANSDSQWTYPMQWKQPWKSVNKQSVRHPYRNLVRHGADRIAYDTEAVQFVLEDLAGRLDRQIALAHLSGSNGWEARAVYTIKQSVGWNLAYATDSPEVADRIATWSVHRAFPSQHFYATLAKMLASLQSAGRGNWSTGPAIAKVNAACLALAGGPTGAMPSTPPTTPSATPPPLPPSTPPPATQPSTPPPTTS